jgi:hypothetical protein
MNTRKSDFQTSDFVRNWRGWAKATQREGKSTPKTTNPWTKTTRNSLNQEIDPRQNLGLFFGNFRIYGGNQESVVNPWKPKAADTI